jgi:ATP-dependent DNA helicase RecG
VTNNLLNIIAAGEGSTTELKSTFQKEVMETVVAFANAKGGQIIIGVSDARHISGVAINSETLKDWLNQIKNNTHPSVLPDIEAYQIDGKTIVQISVTEQPIKPIAYKNRYFKRMQNANHLMSLDEIANEHLKSINSSLDYHLDSRHHYGDISMEKVLGLIQKIEKHKDRLFDEDPYQILQKYELVKEGKLTFAAYLLFVNNISAITSLQIGRFRTETDIIDNVDLNTDLLSQIDGSLSFIRKHLMVEYVITGEAQPQERYDYPLEAIREIVINMVIHRDYRDSGNSIVKIFDDRIEFFNPGKLYGDLTIAQLNSGHYASRTRNRAIANMFKECGLIERYGSGIKRIRNACVKHGLVEPVFEEFQHGFHVVIYKRINGGVNGLLLHIQTHPGQRASEISHALNISLRTIERWLKELRENDDIEFRGASRTGGYFAK